MDYALYFKGIDCPLKAVSNFNHNHFKSVILMGPLKTYADNYHVDYSAL